MSIKVNGTMDEVWVDGRRVRDVACESPGSYTVSFKGRPEAGNVRIIGTPDGFCPGSAFISEPLRIEYSGGRLPAGDWTTAGAMKFYSGGVRYSKDIRIPANTAMWSWTSVKWTQPAKSLSTEPRWTCCSTSLTAWM